MTGSGQMATLTTLKDGFGRSFPYLRLSITDQCNFRCGYCLPEGNICDKSRPAFLNIEEIRRLATAFAALGVSKIRLTGGEPTIRKDFSEIARTVANVPGIKKLAFTTNGYRLRKHAQEWREAGLNAINISIDSLDAKTFHDVTGHDRLGEILGGVDAALDAKFESVKINAVLLKGINDNALPDYLKLAQEKRVAIRFIELMQTGDNQEYFHRHHISADYLVDSLQHNGWTEQPRETDAGPARIFTHSDYAGSVGIIAPYAKNFCQTCNRLRVTAMGDLRLCLFGEQGTSLRHLLQDDEQQPLLQYLIASQLAHKRISHFLNDGDTGITPHLASIGG